MTAPERIWARPDYNECWPKRLEEEDVEYIRADLAAVQPAQVRVKPLVWDDRDYEWCWWSEDGDYRVRLDGAFHCDKHGVTLSSHTSLEAAKSAAQADYEARILAVIEPQPDPRDEVIARLVEAATDAAEAIDMAYGSDDDESPHRHSAKLRAALAAAKAVQHG